MDILSNFWNPYIGYEGKRGHVEVTPMALHKKIVNQKQYCNLGEISEIRDTTRYLKGTEVVIPTISAFNLSYAEDRYI